MTEPKFGKCQCCGTETQLFNAPSRFGEETWACDECWNPDGDKHGLQAGEWVMIAGLDAYGEPE